MNTMLVTFAAFVAFGGGGGDEKKAAPPAIELRLKPAVAVRGLEVTIADLCEVSAPGQDALAIGRIVFGPAPVNGYARTLLRSEIVQSLAAAGRDVSTIKLEGAAEVVVQCITVEIDGEEIAQAATNALQAVLAVEGGDVEFDAPTRTRQIQAPPGRKSQELSARVRNGKTNPDSAVVDVDILVDGTSYKKVAVPFKLRRYREVLKTLGAVRAGSPLGPDNLVVVREATTPGAGLWLDSMAQIDGLIASRNLQPQQRLTLGDAAPPSLIHKGDVVTVVLTRGRVKITAKAVANHDAPLAGRLTLTNTSSRGTMTGIVTAPGLVEVQQ